MTYYPVIVTRIPADIPADRHDDIRTIIDKINTSLSNHQITTRDDATTMAAIALSKSGVGACGYASAERHA